MARVHYAVGERLVNIFQRRGKFERGQRVALSSRRAWAGVTTWETELDADDTDLDRLNGSI
jgi:hypothetical protein